VAQDRSGSGRTLELFFLYPVRDVYGWQVVPENLGYYEQPVSSVSAGSSNPSSRDEGVERIVARGRAMKVVRNGVASFFFHPMYPADKLKAILDGLQREGYTFVAAEALVASPGEAKYVK
jgi:uncharacterized protein YdaL